PAEIVVAAGRLVARADDGRRRTDTALYKRPVFLAQADSRDGARVARAECAIEASGHVVIDHGRQAAAALNISDLVVEADASSLAEHNVAAPGACGVAKTAVHESARDSVRASSILNPISLIVSAIDGKRIGFLVR